MGHLDERGDFDAATVAVYTPVLFLSLFLLFRAGFREGVGWILVSVFAISKIASTIVWICTNFLFSQNRERRHGH